MPSATLAAPVAALPPTAPRQRILAAAVACFARSGFHGASMQEICAEAGMSPGALYRYFPGKDAIIAAIAEAERERHAAFFEQLDQASDPVEVLASVGQEMLEQALAGPLCALAAETAAEAARNPAIRAVFARKHAEARAALARAFRRGQASGLVDPALDVETVASLLLALGDGLLAHQGSLAAPDPDRLRPALRDLVARILRPRTPPRAGQDPQP
jgi:AcrR family transcriptional regulator